MCVNVHYGISVAAFRTRSALEDARLRRGILAKPCVYDHSKVSGSKNMIGWQLAIVFRPAVDLDCLCVWERERNL